MFLHSLANVVPPQRLTQRECWEVLRHSPALRKLRPGARALLEKILTNDSGIESRHFAVGDLDKIFDLDAEALNRAFEREAPALAERALRAALADAKLAPQDLDALIICTCTGYLCPGLTSFVAERAGLRPDIFLQDNVGQGCGAAIPSLRSASHFLAARPAARVACIAVEICSAAFYLDDDPGVLVSLCLFADGASASIWSDRPGPTRLRCDGFDTLHLPADRECLRFENRGGKLRNRLDKTVPERAAVAVRALYDRQNGAAEKFGCVLAHAGGKKVLEAVGGALGGKYPLAESTAVLRQYGNMSSPSVLFALGELLRKDAADSGTGHDPALDSWLVSFGAGFSAHSCRISRA